MPRRSKLERERDLSKLSDQYLKGIPQWKIAEEFGVSQQVISDDLAALRKRWMDSSLRDMDVLIARDLAKIDQLEREYWEAWQRSIGEKQRRTTERASTGDGSRDKAAVVTENMAGDPRFLQGVERCIERRARLLGLDAPSKIAPTDPSGEKPYDPITDTERAARLAEILHAAGARRDREARVSAADGGAGTG